MLLIGNVPGSEQARKTNNPITLMNVREYSIIVRGLLNAMIIKFYKVVLIGESIFGK